MIEQSQPSGTGAFGQWLKIIGFLLALGVALVFARGVGRLTKGVLGNSNDSALAARLSMAAKQISTRAPIKLDATTTLNSAAAAGDTIIYTMSLSIDIPRTKIATAQARLQAADTARVCAGADTRKLIGAGGKMRWIYTDLSGDRFQTNLSRCP
jgi:hypothetical protein